MAAAHAARARRAARGPPLQARAAGAVSSIYKGNDALRRGGIANVVREGARQRFLLAYDTEDEDGERRGRDREHPAGAERQGRAERDERLAEIDGVAYEAIAAVRHERRAGPGRDEGREGIAERAARHAVEHDAGREGDEPGRPPARRTTQQEVLERRAREQEREERVVEARRPERLTGQRLHRLGWRRGGGAHPHHERRDERRVRESPHDGHQRRVARAGAAFTSGAGSGRTTAARRRRPSARRIRARKKRLAKPSRQRFSLLSPMRSP